MRALARKKEGVFSVQKRKLYVLSIDAMIYEDTAFMETLPNLGPFVKRASRVKRVKTVYPSLTYTCHASMITGCYPDRHGIVHNEQFTPGDPLPIWYHYRTPYQALDTLPELAHRSGYKVGSVFWPTTGGLDIDWNVAEIWDWSFRPEDMRRQLMESSTPAFIEEIWPAYGQILQGLSDPYFDWFCNHALAYMIKEKKPDVFFQHLSAVDHARHNLGVFAEGLKRDAWIQQDKEFGMIVRALEESGELENTTFCITSDHGQTPVDHLVCPNIKLVEEGLIRLNEDGSLKDWDVFVNSAAHSAHVYLKDPGDSDLRARVAALLRRWQDEGELGIETIFTNEEVKAHRLTGDFAFVLEGADGYAYSNNLTGPLVFSADNSDYKYSVATHGHLPEKGPQPTFMLVGPGVKPGVELECCDIVDEAPTLAALLGLEMKGVDGKVLHQLLAD